MRCGGLYFPIYTCTLSICNTKSSFKSFAYQFTSFISTFSIANQRFHFFAQLPSNKLILLRIHIRHMNVEYCDKQRAIVFVYRERQIVGAGVQFIPYYSHPPQPGKVGTAYQRVRATCSQIIPITVERTCPVIISHFICKVDLIIIHTARRFYHPPRLKTAYF